MTTTTAERPGTLDEMVGQTETVARIRIAIGGARARGVRAPHLLLSGPAGHGKTTLARIVAQETDGPLVEAPGPTLRRAGDVAGILTAAEPNTVLFIDEIHRLPAIVEEILYEAMEDGSISVTVGSGPSARAVTLHLPPFVLVGATTRPGSLSAPLRDRFGLNLTMAPYTDEELSLIVARAWDRNGALYTDEACSAVGERSKGVPRLAIHLAQRVLDVAALAGTETIGADLATQALEAFGVGEGGIDETDLRILEALVITFSGQPAGLANLAQALDLDVSTIQEQHEGALVRAGLMVRTHSGRMATPRAHALVRGEA